jgi:uncharacterized membrane protein YdbT with pleckstrin-like domain
MNDRIIWSGQPSQYANIPAFIIKIFLFCLFWVFLPYDVLHIKVTYHYNLQVQDALLILSIIIVFWSLIPFVTTYSIHYELTTDRLLIYSGIFTRVREEIELYRLKDYKVVSPLFLRLLRLSKIIIYSSDKTLPFVILHSINDSYKVTDLLRETVEKAKSKRGYLEIDSRV